MKFRRRVLASLVVASSTIAACVGYVHYSSTSQLAVVVNSSTFLFGDVDLGTTSSVETIIFSPASGSGDSVDTITGISFACSDFAITSGSGSGSGLPAEVSRRCAVEGSGSDITQTKPDRDATGMHPDADPQAAVAGSCVSFNVKTATFHATFSPKVQGTQNCTVFFSGTFGTVPISLSGTGKAPPFVIDVSPNNLDFGDVRVLTPSRVVAVAVRNAGSMPLTINSVVLDSGPSGVFDVDGNTGSHMLPVGATEQLDVTCTPALEGSVTTSMRINSNAAGGQVVIPLRCNGIDSALIPDPGSPIDLDTRVNEPITREITVTNTGGASSTINSVVLVGTTEVVLLNPPSADLVVLPGNNFKFQLMYPANAPQLKSNNGKVRITHDTTEVQELVISTQALETEIGSNPDGVNFGPVCAGTTKQAPVTVFATKPGGFQVNGFTTPAAPFSFTGAPGSVTGNHADELTFTASVSPTAEGPASATVTVSTDIPNKASRDLVFDVVGLPAGISGSPADGLDFGTPDLGTTTLFKPAKLTNCSDSDLIITGARIDGEGAADFQFVGVADNLPLQRTLAPTEAIELFVIMAPATPGERIASLVIEHSQTETAIPLTGVGNGTLPEPEDPQGPETYYQCNTSGSGGVLVGFAIFGLLIRRRRR